MARCVGVLPRKIISPATTSGVVARRRTLHEKTRTVDKGSTSLVVQTELYCGKQRALLSKAFPYLNMGTDM